MNAIRFCALVLLVLLAAGCGTAKSKSVPVKGKVILEGSPLSSGDITFDAGDGSVPATMKISNGQYSGNVPPGQKTVRISSFRQGKPRTPAGGPGAGQPSQENIIAVRYNVNSKETREVRANGPNEFNFDLKK